jgi:hypothetical protein
MIAESFKIVDWPRVKIINIKKNIKITFTIQNNLFRLKLKLTTYYYESNNMDKHLVN